LREATNSSPGFIRQDEHQHLRGVTGRDREARSAAFERGDPLLQHRVGWVADTGRCCRKPAARTARRAVDVVEHEDVV
jgi:hypothetical protein